MALSTSDVVQIRGNDSTTENKYYTRNIEYYGGDNIDPEDEALVNMVKAYNAMTNSTFVEAVVVDRTEVDLG